MIKFPVGGTAYGTLPPIIGTDGLPAEPTSVTAKSYKNGSTTATGDTITILTYTDDDGLRGWSYNPAGESELDVWRLQFLIVIGGKDYYHTEMLQAVVPERGTDSALTTLGTNAPSNWINAAAIAASALNDKGNWNIGKTGYELTQAFPANFAALGINASGHISRVVLTDTTTDLTNGGSGGATAQQVWEYATRTLTSAGSGGATAQEVWEYATRSLTDKSGFALTQAFPANFASLGINSSGHVSRVVLVDTTTTNSDMRGTDSALTTLGATAPANWINAAAIASSAITDAKIASNAITAAKVADNTITAAKIAAAAMNGKGDWNVGKTGYTLTQGFPANFAALGINSSGHVQRVVLTDTTTNLTNGGGGGGGATAQDVWEYATRTLTSGGGGGGGDATLAKQDEILAAIAAIEVEGGPVGPGGTLRELTIGDGSGPLDGVAVWVTTDQAGSNVIAGTRYSNGNGKVSFMLDVGEYYVWCQKNGINFPNPQKIEV